MRRASVGRALIATTAGGLLLSGCAEMQQGMDEVLGSVGSSRAVAFECDDDRVIRAAFSSDARDVQINSGGESVDLRLVDRRESGDTRVYENRQGTVRLIDEGDEIHVRVQGKDNFENCQPDDPNYRPDGRRSTF